MRLKGFCCQSRPVSSWEGQLPPNQGLGMVLLSQEDTQTPAALENVDLIILSPGIPREHDLLKVPLERELPFGQK